jgi:hypothetical protein
MGMPAGDRSVAGLASEAASWRRALAAFLRA